MGKLKVDSKSIWMMHRPFVYMFIIYIIAFTYSRLNNNYISKLMFYGYTAIFIFYMISIIAAKKNFIPHSLGSFYYQKHPFYQCRQIYQVKQKKPQLNCQEIIEAFETGGMIDDLEAGLYKTITHKVVLLKLKKNDSISGINKLPKPIYLSSLDVVRKQLIGKSCCDCVNTVCKYNDPKKLTNLKRKKEFFFVTFEKL